jgi:hypothetical protein
VNDISNATREDDDNFFADDTHLFISGSSDFELTNNLERYLRKICTSGL